ncbi:TPA: hypothetical protein ACKOO2_002634 [Clostridioides difficile]|uniref:hypothetical protein n=2 Tax=Clostridioides difficile TaxID=1496 RepID=UPI0003B2A15E|nr:hypothetical protein [Clostridioides difficile]MBY1284031.1 hypothetical protein [Clostridioides difficile]MCD8637700.1 hypothetical protein [Clostridioides difficile]MCE4868442.1 hypothetical protein [Clostridioides difficile]MCE4900424.1 hypothetical protein [Clostridioides difficile]MCP3284406.1 hypothetical protein [Clostridioides difficile]
MLKLYILSIIVFCTGFYLYMLRLGNVKEVIEALKKYKAWKNYKLIFIALFPLLNFIIGLIFIVVSLFATNKDIIESLEDE